MSLWGSTYLDILKDLVETEKNLAKIEKYDEEKKEKEEVMKMDNMSMDRGYSQRKYYIDADYQPGAMPYMRDNSYMDGNSYARGGRGGYRVYDMGNSYMDGGNSYMYYDPRYDGGMYARRGYSRTSSKEEILGELKEMMREAGDEKIKSAISEVISKIDK